MQFDAESGHRLTRLRDAIYHTLCPAFLDTDHDDCRYVRIGPGADERAEMEVEVSTELQPSVGVRYGNRAFDVVRHRLGGGIRQIVYRQDQHMVAHADAVVFAAIAPE